MICYIKARREVGRLMGMPDGRNRLKDGNIILWVQDMAFFGINAPYVWTALGCVGLEPHQCKAEIDEPVIELPEPTDERVLALMALPAEEEEPAEETAAEETLEQEKENQAEDNAEEDDKPMEEAAE